MWRHWGRDGKYKCCLPGLSYQERKRSVYIIGSSMCFGFIFFSPSFPLGLFLCPGTRVALDAWMEIRGVGGVTAKKKE